MARNASSPQLMRVVLIDDDALIRASLRLALPPEAAQVVGEAGNGQNGLELCFREKPDIVFLDISMPDVSGLQLLPGIRDALPMSAVVMVPASNDRATIERALAGGASGFIIKPFSVRTVEQAVQRARASIEARQART
jgi:two-component system chemotaxis response regulator CheY